MEELARNQERMKEVSEALKLAEGKEKEALEILMDSLQDTQDMILESNKQ
jgi:gamma-glutamyl phosphate reductase